jgi:hypothetical protein
VDNQTLTGTDFTVQVEAIKHLDPVENLGPIYWHWAEKMN